MMSLDKYINLLTEEIIGNLATVYHRGDKNKLNHLLNQTYQNQSHIDFRNYNKALYTTTDMASQLNQGDYQFNNMKETYGDYIIKLVFKGISNCWFCDYDEYRKFNNCTIDNWKEQQIRKFNITSFNQNKLFGPDKHHTQNHADISKYFEREGLLGKRVKGIQYKGKGDGNCLLIYDWSTAVPIAISNDEGKTWEKVDKSKTFFSRNNFNKNDYIDTNKKINIEKIDYTEMFKEYIDKNNNFNCSGKGFETLYGSPEKCNNFDCSDNKLTILINSTKEVNGDFDCRNNKLTSLQGAPKKIGGDFDCRNNKLTSLQGAPKIVNGGFNCDGNELTSLKGAPEKTEFFYCSDNKLTSLQGAPEIVNGNFDCSDNKLTSLQGAPKIVNGRFDCRFNDNLSKEEILKYLKTAKIGNSIRTDYGVIFHQEEAIKKLSGLNEGIFNY